MPRRTNDIDINSIEQELDLGEGSGENTELVAELERQLKALKKRIDRRVKNMDDDDPRAFITNVAKEGVRDAFTLLEFIKKEIESGSRSAMMFQSSAHLLTSISTTIEKLNGMIIGAEKGQYNAAKIKIELARLKIENKRLEIAKIKALNQAGQPQGPLEIKDSNVVIYGTREEALEQAKLEDIDGEDDEIKRLEGELLGERELPESSNKTTSD